jgi:flagellar biosynthesis/type III secretory pathway protein FliH
MANIEHWSYCPECGMVWRDARRICEVNGAGAETIPVDPVIGEKLIDYGNQVADAREALRAAQEALEAASAEMYESLRREGLYVCANGHRSSVTRGFTEHERRCYFCGKLATPV